MSPSAFHRQPAHHLHGSGAGQQDAGPRTILNPSRAASAAGERRQSHHILAAIIDDDEDIDDNDVQDDRADGTVGPALSPTAEAGVFFTSINNGDNGAVSAAAAAAGSVHGNSVVDDGRASPPTAAGRRAGKRPAARGTAFYPRKRANTACQGKQSSVPLSLNSLHHPPGSRRSAMAPRAK